MSLDLNESAESATLPRNPKFVNLTGRVFCHVTVLSFAGQKSGKSRWNCVCVCGKRLVASSDTLKTNNRSCGCKRRGNFRHGGKARSNANTGLRGAYVSWHGMLNRCLNENEPAYSNYGGRGISVCSRWLYSFERFLEDMGERPDGMSIDRIDSNGDYTPENCRWASDKTQSVNRRSVVLIEIDGQRKCMSDWAKERGVDVRLISNRIKKGWSPGIVRRQRCPRSG
jgi:hypothetical protein